MRHSYDRPQTFVSFSGRNVGPYAKRVKETDSKIKFLRQSQSKDLGHVLHGTVQKRRIEHRLREVIHFPDTDTAPTNLLVPFVMSFHSKILAKNEFRKEAQNFRSERNAPDRNF